MILGIASFKPFLSKYINAVIVKFAAPAVSTEKGQELLSQLCVRAVRHGASECTPALRYYTH